jgi:hypothetical protein
MRNFKLERLLRGETFITVERGNSMSPLIESGQQHKLAPIELKDVEVKDIVYCKVNGKFYTHLVKAKSNSGILIGNNKGGVNGWTKQVYGKVVKIFKNS